MMQRTRSAPPPVSGGRSAGHHARGQGGAADARPARRPGCRQNDGRSHPRSGGRRARAQLLPATRRRDDGDLGLAFQLATTSWVSGATRPRPERAEPQRRPRCLIVALKLICLVMTRLFASRDCRRRTAALAPARTVLLSARELVDTARIGQIQLVELDFLDLHRCRLSEGCRWGTEEGFVGGDFPRRGFVGA